MVRWRGPWRTSSYRVVVETKRDRTIASEIVTTLFDVPAPSLVLTGDAVWNDRSGSAHFVRHACAADSRASASAMSTAIVHKVLILEYERARARDELYAWLRDYGGSAVDRSLASTSAEPDEILAPGASLLIGYEPRASRTRIAWPGKRRLDLYGDDVMRGIWRFYFDSSDHPAFRDQLVRWH